MDTMDIRTETREARALLLRIKPEIWDRTPQENQALRIYNLILKV